GLHCIALDEGLPPYRCCYITTRLLFLFKLVMESSLGLRSLPGFRSLGDSDASPLLYNYPFVIFI
ncbi:hypothetical protein, partial [uncultured Duncaniella sp.]|uniref:hypothetical protein n=1 Tax=uncultured Duncaniella sp. TaxID=2768039 RepID=UPI0026385EC5